MIFLFLQKFRTKKQPKSSFTMSKIMYDYTKSILERVSFDPTLFCKELEKAIKTLLPYELEQLREWLLNFTVEKPELKQCLILVNSN